MTNPEVSPLTPRVAVASGCELGEGPVWDHRTGTLFFVDIKNPGVWRYQPATGHSSRVDVAERIGFVALTQDPDIVIAGFKSGLARLHLFGGQVQPLGDPEPDKPGNRINDGHVGPDGAIWFGTLDDEGESRPTGVFWRYDGERFTSFGEPRPVTNGPALSPDGRTIYTVDSPGRLVHAHALEDGRPGEARPFVAFDEGWGHPDGMAVDAEGHVWICHWGGSRVSRFSPDGALERVVPVPTAQATKCAFGGPDLTTLFITTAAIGRDRTIDVMAGHLFAVETGVTGLRAHLAEV
jgi:sugar lactone lactonase YvrE